MKLSTILQLNEEINNLNELLKVIEEDYLKRIDDDLWTIDLSTVPMFVEGYDIKIETKTKLTRKYLIRFCEDFGLSLKDYIDNPNENKYVYVFEKQKDILNSLNKYNI